MNRRIFLKKTVTVVSFISLSSFPLLSSCSHSDNLKSAPFIDDFLSEDDIKNILNNAIKDSEKFNNLSSQSNEEISIMIKDDFINGHTTLTDGWVLSNTEVEHLIKQTQN